MKNYILFGIIILIIIAVLFRRTSGSTSLGPPVNCSGHYTLIGPGKCPEECGNPGSSRIDMYKWNTRVEPANGGTACPQATSSTIIAHGCIPTQPCP